jgi:uncharacterized coiled-coil protein SlyX
MTKNTNGTLSILAATGEIHMTKTPDQNHTIESRLERIESALAHLQHDLDALNSSIMATISRLQELDGRFVRLEHDLHTFTDQAESNEPGIERPPHY